MFYNLRCLACRQIYPDYSLFGPNGAIIYCKKCWDNKRSGKWIDNKRPTKTGGSLCLKRTGGRRAK